jgi:putative ABC transport system ATP-binding protein
MDLLFNLHKTYGATLVLVTHDKRLAERCERIVNIEDGRLDRAALELEGAA